MKGSKSKGKTAIQAPPVRAAATGRRGRKKAAVPPINTVAKEFAVVSDTHFLQGKVVFNICQVDPTLARALVYEFNNSRHGLAQASVLLQLKAHRQSKFEVTYRHSLDTHEALLLYIHLVRRRKGDANQLQQLQEMVQLIKLFPLEGKNLVGSFQAQCNQFNRDVEQLRRAVKMRFNTIRDGLRDSFVGSEEDFKAEMLEARIRQISGDLINLMVVAVREVNSNKVEVIFQQSYPQKSCSPKFLINAIGQSRYLKKKCNFVKFYQQARINHRSNANFIVCHICKDILLDSYLRCTKAEQSQFVPTYQNSPNTYQRHLIALDYCYHQATDFTKKQLDNELDYFKYYSVNDTQFVCNRFICRKCSENWVLLDSSKDLFAYNCPFCCKRCLCPSCLLAQELVKALALYKDILVRNWQPLNKYEELVRFANLDHEEDVQVYRRIRCTFKAADRREYYEYYMSTLEKYANITNIIDQYQAEAVRSLAIFKQLQPRITEEMIEIRSFFLSLKQQHTNKQQPITGKKSLALVKNDNTWFEQQLLKKQEMEKYEQNLLIKSLNHNTLNKEKQLTLKEKFLNECSLSRFTFKYQVPFQLNELAQHEQSLEQTQLGDLQTFLAAKLRSVDPSLVGRVVTIKKEVPFQQVDYELALNVRSECKIVKERDIQLKKNTDAHIMYHEDHPVYGFRGVESSRFHNDADEFMFALNRIDSSDSQEEIYEGSTPLVDPGSVSISSHFLREHGVELVREQSNPHTEDQELDDEAYENASSSFLLIGEADSLQKQQTHEPMEQQRQDQMNAQ